MAAQTSVHAEMGLLISRLARVWRRVVDQALSRYGLSEATALPLLILFRTRDRCARLGVLAKAMGIEGPSLVRIIDLLQNEGLLERRDDQTDRRAKLLHLTALGKTKAEQADRVIGRIRADLLEGISDEELAVTFDVLRRVELRADRCFDECEAAGDRK